MGNKKNCVLTALLLLGGTAAGAYALRDRIRQILHQTDWDKPAVIDSPAPLKKEEKAPAKAEPAPIKEPESVPVEEPAVAEASAQAELQPITVDTAEKPVIERSIPVPAVPTETVWWTKNGKSYHRSRECRTLSRSSANLCEGTLEEALAAGKTDPCDLCSL